MKRNINQKRKMRTREEIIEDCNTSDIDNLRVLEVLLDIRELLISRRKQ